MITGKTVSMFQISQKSKGPKKLYIKFGHIFGINFVLIKFKHHLFGRLILPHGEVA